MPQQLESFDFMKEVPHSVEAEQSVIASCIVEPDCIQRVLQYVKPEYFYVSTHRAIFSIMLRKFLAAETIDFVTLLEDVCKEKIFDDDSAAKIYFTEMIKMLPTASNVEEYARIVRDKYYLRSLVSTFQKVVDASREGYSSPDTLMELAEQEIYNIRQGKNVSGFVKIDEILLSTYDKLQHLTGADKDDYLGIPTGYTLLDAVTTGLNKSDLIILAARPGMGKSSFALNVGTNVAKAGKKVAFFSLEMSKEQLVEKILMSEALVPSDRMKKGTLTGDDWQKIAIVTNELSKLEFYIDDTAGTTLGDMKSKLRRLKDVGVVIIDYLQLMTMGGKRNDNRVQEVSELTRNLKIMAKEFNIPVIALSQLSRGPESRSDKRPMLSDLRESGSIEQDADMVWFLYRDDYYNPDCKEPGIAECIIAKNRHGETSSVKMGWDGQYTKFRNAELSHAE